MLIILMFVIGSVIINHWHLLHFCFAVANEVKQKPCSLRKTPNI